MSQEVRDNNSLIGRYKVDENGFFNFGEISRDELGMQSQYASRYVSGLDRPKLSEGLRIVGDPDDYHNLKIHADDAEEFIRRVKAHRAK